MEHIYPKCPVCGKIAPEGNGVELHDLPNFKWECAECYSYCHGFFLVETSDVKWIHVVKHGLLRSRIKRFIVNLIRRNSD